MRLSIGRIMETEAMQMTYPEVGMLIDGQWREAAGGRTLDVANPATGVTIGTVARADISDLDLALAAAQRGFETWRYTPANERALVMRRAASLLRERVTRISALMTMEQGKPLMESRAEVLAGADIIEWFADEGRRAYGRIVPSRNLAAQQLVLKEGVGPVAAFTPWNFPINQIARKLGAALATGCSFLVKAPEETPASPAAFIQTFVDAGIPPGVIGIVFGDPAQISQYLISHPVIRKITFTGSTAVGKQLAALAGSYMKRSTMELGGHAPVIVTDSADLDVAVQASASAKFRNAGQVCIAPTRFLVHTSLKDEFSKRIVAYANCLKVGDGLAEGTTLGPLANSRRVSAMTKVTEDALQHGARLEAGGSRIDSSGNFFAPTVLTDVPLTSDVFNNEPFGPIVAIRGYDKLEDAISEANRLPYGLAAFAFTTSIRDAHVLGQRLEAGMLWVNQPATPSAEMPFGDIKDSGYGSEGGPEALDPYLVTKAVSIMAN